MKLPENWRIIAGIKLVEDSSRELMRQIEDFILAADKKDLDHLEKMIKVRREQLK